MINFAKLIIHSDDDYNQLLDIIDDTHIDKNVVNILKEYIGTKCNALLVEYPYYEKDYLSTYYSFYSKQHTSHSKLCFRIHFLVHRAPQITDENISGIFLFAKG